MSDPDAGFVQPIYVVCPSPIFGALYPYSIHALHSNGRWETVTHAPNLDYACDLAHSLNDEPPSDAG